jgi:hypothetical protein
MRAATALAGAMSPGGTSRADRASDYTFSGLAYACFMAPDTLAPRSMNTRHGRPKFAIMNLFPKKPESRL